MTIKSWSTRGWPRTAGRVNCWRPWVYTLLVLALAAQAAPGCRNAPLRPAPPSWSAPTATPTVESARTTAPATITPSPPTTASPSGTWTTSPTETGAGDAQARGSPTDASATLRSLRKVDHYPLYTMRYYGAYGPQASQAESPSWATNVTQSSTWACSLFAALGDAGDRLYGRNFDWRYSPALLLFTNSPDGYASVSMVDIAYLVAPSDVRGLTGLPLEDREPLLEAPLWPFDGMNEHGLVVGMAAVPESQMPYDGSRETIDSLGVIREMLDHARDVDEAIAVLDSYNVTWNGGPPLHYLIADAAGHAVLIEYYAGEMVLIPRSPDSPWHVATNHLRAPLDGVVSPCWRYDAIRDRLAASRGSLALGGAVELLADVAQENTQWSVVYDLSYRSVHVVMGRDYERVYTFQLGP